jgi:large-conductance mechanosensitive channel
MIDLIIGIAIGSAFAPFWMMVWNNYIKPMASKFFTKAPPKA